MASFSSPFIRRPVATIMLNLSLIVFGLLGLQRLPVRELPDIDAPIVNVLAIYPGASASVVESEVTERLEDAISGVEQIKILSSVSREQVSSITIEFNNSHDIEIAAQDVRDAVARSRGALPEDVEDPIVSKQDANARPVMWISFFSDQFNTTELTRIADEQVRERLQNVSGVSSVIIGGEKRRAIRLRLDSKLMASRGVTVQDIERALINQNVELPSGRMESRDLELTIQSRGELKTPAEFDRLVIFNDGDALVRFQDVGRAEWGVEDERVTARFKGNPTVGLGVVRQSKANTLEVASGVKAVMAELAPSLPEGIQFDYPYDESVFVERAVIEVWETLAIAFALVVLTIFVFLRSPRATLVPAAAIPVSIVATFGCMYALGFSINIFTLLALVLAIGLVVDDAIVVLENIYRHLEEGKKPMEAAFMAMDEISFAVIATTLSLVAVFLPLAFVGGITGRLLLEFAVALSFAVMVSSLVALTLAPMMGGRILRAQNSQEHGKVFRAFERGFDRIAARYERSLGWVLRHRLAMIVIALFSVGISGYLFMNLDQEFLPEEDKGRMLILGFTPEGSTTEFTDRMVRQAEEILKETPEVDAFFSAVALPFNGPGNATQFFIFTRLVDGERRHIRDVVAGPAGLGARMFTEVEGAISFPILPKAVDARFDQPFQLILQHPNLERLNQVTQEIANHLRGTGALDNIRSSFELNKPELEVRYDRDRAASLGISIEEISRSLQINFGGVDLSDIKLDGKQYEVIAQLEADRRMTPEDLENLYVRAGSGDLVPLASVVSLNVRTGPNQIERYQRQRSATLGGTPAGGTLGSALEQAEQVLAEYLPEDVSYAWGGESRDLQESSADIYGFFILAIIVVYMVLAAQFESFIHPLTVMLSLPLAFLGAFALLYWLAWTNVLGEMLYGWVTYAPSAPQFAVVMQKLVPRISSMNLNIFSQVGLVLLVGLVTKNSILLVEFANQLVAKGMTAKEAMMEAGAKRLRPILMTSMATIMGILPIAIGFGDAAESRRPLGVVAVGGMISSTILTLLVIPVIYTLFAEMAEKWKHRGNPNS
ncbi:MAG: efflux RND transporter permease subunit [Kiritimatiellia bacterium]